MNKTFFSDLFFKRFPQFLSVIFHPLLMPTAGIYIILNSGANIWLLTPEARNIIFTVVASCTFGLPVAFIPFFYYRKITTSLDISKKHERILPLVITVSLYYLSFSLLHRMGFPIFIQAFLFASTLAVMVTLLITIKWKISAHLVGVGGIIGLIITMSVFYRVNMDIYLIFSILFTGLAAFARLSLNAHTPQQVYIGFATGLLVIAATFFCFKLLYSM